MITEEERKWVEQNFGNITMDVPSYIKKVVNGIRKGEAKTQEEDKLISALTMSLVACNDISAKLVANAIISYVKEDEEHTLTPEQADAYEKLRLLLTAAELDNIAKKYGIDRQTLGYNIQDNFNITSASTYIDELEAPFLKDDEFLQFYLFSYLEIGGDIDTIDELYSYLSCAYSAVYNLLQVEGSKNNDERKANTVFAYLNYKDMGLPIFPEGSLLFLPQFYTADVEELMKIESPTLIRQIKDNIIAAYFNTIGTINIDNATEDIKEKINKVSRYNYLEWGR